MSDLSLEDIVEANDSRPKQEYVLGFLYRLDGSQVALIEHQKFQKLNGIGGKVEGSESHCEAMAREFLEETGALVAWHEWTQFCSMSGPDYRVTCYVAYADREISTQKEGLVRWYNLSEVFTGYPFMENLSWLIPMSRDKNIAAAAVVNF